MSTQEREIQIQRALTFLIKDKKEPGWIAKRLGMKKVDVEKACIAILGMSADRAIKEKSYEVNCAEWIPKVG